MCFLNIVDCEFSFFNVMSDFLCRRERQFRVLIRLASKPDVYTLQVLGVILSAASSEKYLTLAVLIKVSFFVCMK